MSDRTTYYVTTSTDDGIWKVKGEGAERAVKNFEKKDDAVEFAKEMAKNNKPSAVKIQKRDGTFQDGVSYD
jgi:hypothetical protein